MNFKGNSYGPVPWCLVFREYLYGPMALKVHEKSLPGLALIHGKSQLSSLPLRGASDAYGLTATGIGFKKPWALRIWELEG